MAKKQEDLNIALLKACKAGDLEGANTLIHQGANVNYKDGYTRWSPLYMASREGHAEVVEMLISKGAVVNDQDRNGISPLYFTSKYGHLEVVEMLIKNGAIVNIDTIQEFTPLYAACEKGHEEVVKFLLSKGATIHEETIEIAEDNGHDKIVNILKDWPRTMAIVALQENHAYNLPDMTYLTDLDKYMGTKRDAYGKKSKKRKSIKYKKSIKSKKFIKSKKSIKKRKRI